jgi:hypothetical protein
MTPPYPELVAGLTLLGQAFFRQHQPGSDLGSFLILPTILWKTKKYLRSLYFIT